MFGSAFLPSYFTCNGWIEETFFLSLIFWISSSILLLIIVFGFELLFLIVVLISLIKSLIGSVFTFFKNCSLEIGLKKLVILDCVLSSTFVAG